MSNTNRLEKIKLAKESASPKVAQFLEWASTLTIVDSSEITMICEDVLGIKLGAVQSEASTTATTTVAAEVSTTITIAAVDKANILAFVKAYRGIVESGKLKGGAQTIGLVDAKKIGENPPITLEVADPADVSKIKALLEGIVTFQ